MLRDVVNAAEAAIATYTNDQTIVASDQAKIASAQAQLETDQATAATDGAGAFTLVQTAIEALQAIQASLPQPTTPITAVEVANPTT